MPVAFPLLTILKLLVILYSITKAQTGVDGYKSDNTETPLIGISITVKNSTKGVLTNEKGYFSISNLERGNHQLTISYVGLKTKVTYFSIDTKQQVNVNSIIL
tara:strand:- start:206 stop:514 length:309 start_codon:yes stop_codon:yes gene_type:complete